LEHELLAQVGAPAFDGAFLSSGTIPEPVETCLYAGDAYDVPYVTFET
jgi:hypothetical protein